MSTTPGRTEHITRRDWLIFDDTCFAVDDIVAFAPVPARNLRLNVHMRGGHIIMVYGSVEEMADAIRNINTTGDTA